MSENQRQQVIDGFARYISAIYADRFDSYAGQKLQVTDEQPEALVSSFTQPDRQSEWRARQGRPSDAQ
jgi:ABC-type transporter MlaC component